jgi:Tfp pilus assembly protein PilX
MNHKSTLPKQRLHQGIALPLVLVCLVLIGAVSVVVLRTVVLQHRHLQTVEQQDQALWLAESALQRAANRLRTSPDYAGEVWNVAADTLGGIEAAEVKIEVTPQEDGSRGWRVVVEAIYPIDAPRSVLERREAWIPAS